MKNLAILAVIGLVASVSGAAEITFTLINNTNGTFELYVEADQGGLSGYSIDLVDTTDIDNLSVTGVNAAAGYADCGFNLGRSVDGGASPLTGAQNNTQPNTLVYNFGTAPGGFTAVATPSDLRGTVNNPFTYAPGLGTLLASGTFSGDGADFGPEVNGNVFESVGSQYSDVADVTTVVVPEPATMSLLGLGGVFAAIRRRRRA